MDKDILKNIIDDYERDILGNRYTLFLSNSDTLSFCIEKDNIPHLLGVRKLPLRQVQNKSAQAVYAMLKDGRININHIAPYRESYKKAMNFSHLISILHCGDAVKIVKRIGTLNSSYLLFLDHRPQEIIHLGLAEDYSGQWHPESLLVLRRNVTSYIDGQLPVDIIKMEVTDARVLAKCHDTYRDTGGIELG